MLEHRLLHQRRLRTFRSNQCRKLNRSRSSRCLSDLDPSVEGTFLMLSTWLRRTTVHMLRVLLQLLFLRQHSPMVLLRESSTHSQPVILRSRRISLQPILVTSQPRTVIEGEEIRAIVTVTANETGIKTESTTAVAIATDGPLDTPVADTLGHPLILLRVITIDATRALEDTVIRSIDTVAAHEIAIARARATAPAEPALAKAVQNLRVLVHWQEVFWARNWALASWARW